MELPETRGVLDYLTASFRQEMTDAQVVPWVETLVQVDQHTAFTTIRELRQTQDWLPTHHEFLAAASSVIRRWDAAHEVAAGEAPDACALCQGTGWQGAGAPYVLSSGTVRRCACRGPSDRRQADPDKHHSGCTCLSCHYGADRASVIRAGRDGITGTPSAGGVQTLAARAAVDALRKGMKV